MIKAEKIGTLNSTTRNLSKNETNEKKKKVDSFSELVSLKIHS